MFEKQVYEIHQKFCHICHSVSIFLDVKQLSDGRYVCTECYNAKLYEKTQYEQNLPIWIDCKKTIHYESPDILTCLTDGEKLLIQQVNSYIPLVHIKNGQLGIKGHVVAFPQHVQEICTVLPRLPSETTIIKVTQTYQEKEGSNIVSKSFLIRKEKVLNALTWLQNHNIEYSNITIEESKLDWIENGTEQNLEAESVFIDFKEENYDIGPSKSQTYDVELQANLEESFGLVTQEHISFPTKKDNIQTNQIIDAIKNSKLSTTISFPYVESEPVDEFDPNIKLFCKAFPWLFPGGLGDYNDYNNTSSINKWIKKLLLYHDGRFARDKMWCFYAQDFQTRQNNINSGGYFIDGFFKNGPQTLDDLKCEIQAGNTAWIDQITYFSNRISGTPSYWRLKRSQVYSWINFHIEQNHGPPTLFITLSCAEYFWPDVQRLIKERFSIVKMKIPSLDKNYVQTVNDYTLIVQELFQKRVELWLETVGKDVFEIQYYWGRYEFTKQRGQIHTHLLAITKYDPIQDVLFLHKNNKRKQAEMLQKFVQTKYLMTASIPQDFHIEMSDLKHQTLHPAKFRYSKITNKQKDSIYCLKYMQQHHCSNYCMRKRKFFENKETEMSKKRRICRCGAGVEESPNSNRTPGFIRRKTPTIERDLRGFLRLDLSRNDKRTVQSSLAMLQGWRANCDIQLILYESNPVKPDLQEIANVTDYVVAYACKGNDSLLHERKDVYNQVMQAESLYESNKDIKRLARQILNKTVSRRIISKQEVMVNLANLNLTFCSESIENVSLSGSYRLSNKPTRTFLSSYANRPLEFTKNMSLHEYFNFVKNITTKSKKTIIPHYVGASCQPVYPPTRSYARSIMLIFCPWNKTFEDHDKRDFVKEFKHYINNETCHPFVKISYERQKQRVQKNFNSLNLPHQFKKTTF